MSLDELTDTEHGVPRISCTVCLFNFKYAFLGSQAVSIKTHTSQHAEYSRRPMIIPTYDTNQCSSVKIMDR